VSADSSVRLRTITVSTRAALQSLERPEHATDVIRMANALLNELERDLLANGADPDLLRGIADARDDLARHETAASA
jgi:hypothetical protein